jgi:hypothetical protein
MEKLPANLFLTGGENRANHCQNPGAGFVASGARQIPSKVFGEFHFDQGLIGKVVGLRQNGMLKCFGADGETRRWFSRRFSAASFWLIASATAKIKAFINIVWRFSRDKSCAQSAQADFKTLITLLRMVNLIAHKYRPDARGRFTGQPPLTYFAAVKAGFRRCKIRGRNGRKLPNAFCVLDTSLPVCLRAGFQLGGRINGPDEKALCSKMETSHLKNR